MTVNEAFQRIRDIRERALADASARTAQLDAEYPDIAAVDSELSRTGEKIAGAVFSPDCESLIASIRSENESLQQRRRELLGKHGIPLDFDEPRFSCPICGDTGYDGKKYCVCVRRMCSRDCYERSGLGQSLLVQTFENFSLKYYGGADREKMETVLDVCRDFADTFGGGDNLLLIGGTGLGKTHLSSAIAQRVIDSGYSVVYDSAQNVFDCYERVRFAHEAGDTERYLTCDLLIIDDLGSEFTTQYTSAVLYRIVNERLIKGKSTVLSTNLDNKELKKRYGDRIYSRLLGNYGTCVFAGSDIRLLKLGE